MGCTSSVQATGPCVHELYSFHEKLGQGAFGQVRAAVRLETQDPCAVKILDVGGSRKRRSEAQMEQLIWQGLGQHQHILNLMEVFADRNFRYFVMEKCDRSLLDMLCRKEGLEERDLLNTFHQMLLGLQHCHSLHVVHRDVKPANFLVTSDGIVKLCDFGLADFDNTYLGGLRGIAGTAPFMSPEMVLEHIYDCKTDIWSLGATAYLILYGCFVYPIDIPKNCNSPNKLMHAAIASNDPPPAYKVQEGLSVPSTQARGFVQALLQRDPLMRPSAGQCLKMSAMRCKDAVVPRSKSSLKSTLRLVRQRTAEFKVQVDPTVAKTMDELLQQQQRKFRGSLARGFTMPIQGSKSIESSIQYSRSMSHGGEISLSAIRLDDTDALSECSTAANSGSTKNTVQSL
jgi:serine/threonine protein kinase